MKNMKKRIIIAIVTMICIFSLTACGPDKDAGMVNDTEEETVEEVIEKEPVTEKPKDRNQT